MSFTSSRLIISLVLIHTLKLGSNDEAIGPRGAAYYIVSLFDEHVINKYRSIDRRRRGKSQSSREVHVSRRFSSVARGEDDRQRQKGRQRVIDRSCCFLSSCDT